MTATTHMVIEQVLHMNGGEEYTSYANNSLPQRLVILKTKPFIEEAIVDICSTTTMSKSLSIADLGCAAGPNSLLPLTMALDAAHQRCQCSAISCLEFQVFLNDLPGNDYNNIFNKTIPTFYDNLKEEKGDRCRPMCFISATPGSFYGRLFPKESLHFVYSANSVHWLSQVPFKLGDLNKGNVCLGKSSPSVVFEAYLEQFQNDFTLFLKLRSQEIVPRGRMVLSMMGRTMANPFAEECYHDLDDLSDALKDMVAEGFVEESKLDSFNMPYYEPYIEELKEIIQAEGSFDMVRLEAKYRLVTLDRDKSFKMVNHKIMTNCIRAVVEPLLTYHFGQTLMVDKLFDKYEEKFLRSGVHKSVILVVSLAKKG